MAKGKFTFSDHAVTEMQRRGISKDIVLKCMDEDAQVYPVRKGRVVSQKIIGKYLYRVFVDIDTDPAVIVTTYRTSKVEKYWRKG